MKTNTIILIGILALLAIGALWYFSGDNNDVMESDNMMNNDNAMENTDDSMMADEEDVMEDDSMMDSADAMNEIGGSYEEYSPEKLARADSGKVVLFFRASWCPTCAALHNDINSTLDAIPSGVTILDVNYDTETALKQKYGVTYQHTFVQVNSDGSVIKKWSGSNTLDKLIAEIE